MNTIGPHDNGMGLKYIIVIIDTFTCYLFPKHKVTAKDALWCHTAVTAIGASYGY